MEDKIKMLLKAYGLDEKEIKIYIKLVQEKELNAYMLAKKVGIHRSTTYHILDRLISKGFISKIEKGNKIYYSALEIDNILLKIKDKESILLSLIPELEKVKENNISNVRVFETIESQKRFGFNLFNQITKEGIKEIFIIDAGPSEFLDPQKRPKEDLSSQIFLENLLRELKRKNIHKKVKIKTIWNEKFRENKLLEFFSGLGENKFLVNLPTLATMVIYGDFLAYLFTTEDGPKVIEIQNKLIAEENRIYFNHIWRIAKH